MRVTNKHVGGLLGLAIGWMIVHYGLFQAVFVVALVAVGWLLGRVLDGEIDVRRLGIRHDEDLE